MTICWVYKETIGFETAGQTLARNVDEPGIALIVYTKVGDFIHLVYVKHLILHTADAVIKADVAFFTFRRTFLLIIKLLNYYIIAKSRRKNRFDSTFSTFFKKVANLEFNRL